MSFGYGGSGYGRDAGGGVRLSPRLILALIIAVLTIGLRQIVVFPLLYFSGLDQRNAEVTQPP